MNDIEQSSLFPPVQKHFPDARQVMPTELHRRSDPQTSVDSAVKIQKLINGQCLALWRALRKQGRCTMTTLAEKSGLDYYMIQKRITVLERKGKARRKEIGMGDKGNPVYESENGRVLWEAL